MALRRIAVSLIACCSLLSMAAAQNSTLNNSFQLNSSTVEHTQDFSKTVVPITSSKLIPSMKLGLSGKLSPKLDLRLGFGTGFCLDAGCRFIATNYHVAVGTPAHRIKRQKIVQRYLATGPDDKDATANFLPQIGVVPYAVKRDLALFELRRPLPGHHGLSYSLDDLEVGQEVDIYGYPKGMINPIRRLTRVPARYKGPTTSGLLAFEYDLSSEKPMRVHGGASGGIVVDRKTQRIVGIVSGTTETLALAVSVQTLVDFVSKVQPFVAVKTFPAFKNPSPLSVDLYPKFEPPPDFNSKFEPTHAGVLQRRPAEPHDVTVLRERAQRLADGMRNFVALQSFWWGSGDREPEAHAEYEVRVIDGDQRYRSYPDGKKEQKEVQLPNLNGWALAADEWSELPQLVGTEYRLKIQRAEDSEVDGKKIKIFQYRSVVEDNLCPFQPIDDYIFFSVGKPVAVGCYGEAWMDSDENIIRISENLDLSNKLKEYKGWNEFRVVLTYGLIKIADEPSRLAPLTIFAEGHNKEKIHWCRGTFSNYRLFASHSTLVATKQDANLTANPQ